MKAEEAANDDESPAFWRKAGPQPWGRQDFAESDHHFPIRVSKRKSSQEPKMRSLIKVKSLNQFSLFIQLLITRTQLHRSGIFWFN